MEHNGQKGAPEKKKKKKENKNGNRCHQNNVDRLTNGLQKKERQKKKKNNHTVP
jgi:hypothetical protein